MSLLQANKALSVKAEPAVVLKSFGYEGTINVNMSFGTGEAANLEVKNSIKEMNTNSISQSSLICSMTISDAPTSG